MILFPLAISVVLAWDANSAGDDVTSYRVYVGILSLIAGNPPLVSYSTTNTQYQVDGLDYGTEYFFTVTAVNSNGMESNYSNEIQYTPRHGKKPD
jgi:chitodextrinase